LGITSSIFLFRYLFVRIFRITEATILYIAPRGLITILLFLSIAPEQVIPIVNKSTIVQVIILTALIMMTGLLTAGKHKSKPTDHDSSEKILKADKSETEQ